MSFSSSFFKSLASPQIIIKNDDNISCNFLIQIHIPDLDIAILATSGNRLII